jgi:hypothetical protein
MTATSPVGVPPLPATEVLSVTVVPWVKEVDDEVKVVVLAVPLLPVGHQHISVDRT